MTCNSILNISRHVADTFYIKVFARHNIPVTLQLYYFLILPRNAMILIFIKLNPMPTGIRMNIIWKQIKPSFLKENPRSASGMKIPP